MNHELRQITRKALADDLMQSVVFVGGQVSSPAFGFLAVVNIAGRIRLHLHMLEPPSIAECLSRGKLTQEDARGCIEANDGELEIDDMVDSQCS